MRAQVQSTEREREREMYSCPRREKRQYPFHWPIMKLFMNSLVNSLSNQCFMINFKNFLSQIFKLSNTMGEPEFDVWFFCERVIWNKKIKKYFLIESNKSNHVTVYCYDINCPLPISRFATYFRWHNFRFQFEVETNWR